VRNAYKILVGEHEGKRERDLYGRLDVDGRILLRYILRNKP
jgi:hypothetical protein